MKKTPIEFAASMTVGSESRSPTADEARMIADGITGYLEHLGIGVSDRPLEVGDRVRWVSSNTRKKGEIVAIVPPGSTPKAMGYRIDGGFSRDHVSYVVKGRRTDSKDQPVGSATLYWPLTSLLQRERI